MGEAPEWVLPGLPWPAIEAAYERAAGHELESGKLESAESSAALVANAFGFFLGRPEALPVGALLPACGERARRVDLERRMRFPWRGGRHPWLDVVVETDGWLIGVESKRFEPFRGTKPPEFSDAYDRPVWGDAMGPFTALRDALKAGTVSFAHLDAAQLVKHAFGLRTQAHQRALRPALVYLFAEPPARADGRPIDASARAAHRAEVTHFADLAAGAEVPFTSLAYADLLAAWRAAPDPALRRHCEALTLHYQLAP